MKIREWSTTIREWSISKPNRHVVRVEDMRLFPAKARILVDGQEIYQRSFKFFQNRYFEHRFELDDLPCIVRVRLITWNYEYELWVDGKLQ